VEILLGDGLSLALDSTLVYDRIFLKEVVHHFALDDLPAIFTGIPKQLRPGGIMVIMTR